MAQIKKISIPKHKKTTIITFIVKANLKKKKKKIPWLPFIYSFFLLDSFIHNLLSFSFFLDPLSLSLVQSEKPCLGYQPVQFTETKYIFWVLKFSFSKIFFSFVCLLRNPEKINGKTQF